MDHPSHSHFLHQHQHHSRYVPLPSHHHHPRHPQFPVGPISHNPRPHHLPPPPPAPTLLPPPPPPPMSYRTIHTPPPTHSHPHNPPHQSSFRFNAPNYAHRPIEEDRPISTKHLHDFTYSHRVSNRMLIDNDRPRHNLPDFDHCNPENRIGVWNPTRVLSDNRPSRPYSPLDFDREYPVDNNTVSPYPTVNKLRYDAEGSSRLRMEHIDRYEVNTREDFVWGRGDETYHRRGNFASNVDTSSGNFGIVPSQITLSRDIDSKSGGYVQMHGDECDNGISRGSRRESRNGLGESKRWVNDRKVPRDLHDSSFELGSNEMGADDDDDGIQIMSGKREYYASEFGRYNRGSREDAHEFSRPPKKQTQKKSALRRIQMVKPMYRNREIEQLHYTSYVDDSNSNSFRGKDQLGYSGYGIKAEERERSPVELDISFKSNSLVAKAIVAPSSSAIVFDKYLNLVSDTDLTPSEKNKKVLVSDSDCPDLQQAKPSMGAVNLNNSPSGANDTSSSGKGLNLRKNASDSCSQPFSIASNDSLGKNDVAQCTKKIVSDETTKICSGKTSSRLVKKRKIVKKLVKKLVVNPNSHVSMSLSANMLDGTVQPGSGIPNPSFPPGSDKFETPMMEKITAVDKASMLDSLPSLPIEGNLLPGNIEGNIPPLSLGSRSRSQECETNEDSDIGQTSSNEISENISISQLCASSNKDRKSDSDCLHADNSKLLTGSTFSDISKMDDVNKHSSQNEVSLSPGKNSNEGFSENSYHVGDNADCRLLSLADNVINTDPINTYNSVNGRDLGSNSNDIMIMGKSQEKIKVCDINIDGIVDEGRCKNTASTVSQDAILEENPETAILVPSCGTLSLSNSGKSRIQEGAECLQSSSITKQGSDFDSTFLEGDVTIPHCGFMNNSGKQVPPSDVTVFPEICASDRVPNSKISVGFGDVPTNWIKKRKVRTDLNFLSSQIDGISIDTVSLVEPSYVGDTLKDSSLSAVLDPGIQSLDSSLQSNVDGVAVLHGKKGVPEAEVYVGDNGNDDSNGASPMSKRKKFTVNHRSFIPSQAQFSEAIVVTTSCAEVPTSTSVNQLHQKEVVLSSMTILSTAPTYPEEIAKFPDYSLVGRSFESMDAYMNTVSSEHLELQDPSIASHSLPEELPVPNVQFSEREGNSKQNSTPIVPINNTEKDILLIGNISGEKIDIQAEEEKHRFTDFAQRSPRADMESNDLSMKKILPPEQNCVPCLADGDGVSTSNSNDELIDAVPGPLSDICSPRTTYGVSDGRISDCRAFHDDSMCGVNESVDRHSMVDHGIDLPACAPTTEYTMKDMKCDHATGRNNLMMGKIVPQGPQPSQVCSKFVTQGMNSSCSELKGGKSQSGGVIPRTFLGQSSFNFAKSKTPASSTHISKPRTWHRSSNNSLASLPRSKPLAGIVPLKGPISGKKRNFQNTSYIRKGNSLVRKPAPFSASPLGSSVNQSPSLGLDELQKSTRSEGGVDITDQPNLLKTGVTSSPLERQRTLSLPIDTEFPNHTTTSSEEIRSSPMIEPVSIGCCESASDAKKLGEINDALNYAEYALKCTDTPENQTGPSNNEESPVEANDGNMSSLNTKKIVYVKRKSNQLVATSNSCDLSVSTDDKAQSASSDGYYKRSKNQLIRTTFENINQTVGAPNGTANSDRQGTGKVPCNRRFSKRRSHKVAGRSCKPLRASLVWTLCGTNSSKNSFGSVHHQKVLPHLFPWKRATYLRSFIHNPALNSNTSSLPAISKKLLLLRKRDTIYTRSTHGLSLRKSKVLGVAGSSLKWSKSIENRSKKANEEATLAVAAVERKKREQKDATCISSRAKRERIFRIGLVRYRMDPSRRTLQRISDDESMSSASIRSGLDAKRSYIPRRLVIGNDEYVHIGNGNQLIRDPKKRTRILANEKVRWSLHTARQRLARRQKYCQFFTRFGKCNKDDGKCPYIHDPSKIAVCTKFLNGLCSTPNCNLTHKVIPERMPDCSYFLQGLCSNRNCPYRHVSVNPKASICEGFLRGYCAEGNECRKKHSYVCPAFEATGTCAQGTKCKLHHPKKHKGKKRRRSGDQKNRRGRYFGSMPVDVSEPGMMVAPRQCQKNNDDLEGELADYISLDVDDEITESISQSVEQETLFDSDPLDLQLDNLDELIKPVLIMKKNFTAQSSTVQ